MDLKNLLFDISEGIGTITFNRPDALNALNLATLSEMECVLYETKNRKDVGALILTGAGKAFVAGADIKEMAALGPKAAYEFAEMGQRVLLFLERLPKPVIAAVNGYALGGGCEISLACDLVIASEKASFGQPEVSLGIIPGFGGTQRLARRIGPMRAKDLILSGRRITAEEAFQIGLVLKVVPHETLLQEARLMARQILSQGPFAVSLAKRAIDNGYGLDMERGLEMERGLFAVSFDTEDRKEGIAAFIEKRKASFKGN